MLRRAESFTLGVVMLGVGMAAGCKSPGNPYAAPAYGSPYPPPAGAPAGPLPPVPALPPPPAAAPAPAATSSTQMPAWNNPGTITQQQQAATMHDPYGDTMAGPEIVGGRPREFQKPLAEPVRSRGFRDTRFPF